MQPPKYLCPCQQPPVLICAQHLGTHFESEGDHSFVRQALSHSQSHILLRMRSCLESASQSAVGKVYRQVDDTVQALLEQIQQHRVIALERIQNINTECIRMRKELKTLLTSGWGTVEQALVFDANPVAWLLENIQNAELKTRLESKMRNKLARKKIVVQANPVSVLSNAKNKVKKLKATMMKVASIHNSVKTEPKTSEDDSICQPCPQIKQELQFQSINSSATDCATICKTAQDQQWKQWAATLAFSALTVSYSLQKAAVTEWLECEIIDQLNSTPLANRYSDAINDLVASFTAKMSATEHKAFKRVLKGIIMQTQTRNDITQASANAMNLLIEMKHCFASQNLRSVQLEGTNLSGTNLTKTNLKGANLQNARLRESNLMGVRLQRANLRGADFGQIPPEKKILPTGAVSFSPDGEVRVSYVSGDTVTVWNTKTDERVNTVCTDAVFDFLVCVSPDASLIASREARILSKDEVKLWDTRTGQQTHTLMHQARAMCFSFDGSLIATSCHKCYVILWDTALGTRIRSISTSCSRLNVLCFSPEPPYIATRSDYKSIEIWGISVRSRSYELEGHSDFVTDACCSPDGTMIASSSMDKTVCLWKAATGQKLRVLNGHSSSVWTVRFSPDGRFIASASTDCTIVLWMAETGENTCTFRNNSFSVASPSLLSDTLLTVSEHRAATYDDLNLLMTTHAPVKKFRSDKVNAVCFSSDSSLIASGVDGETVIVWDAQRGQKVQVLKSHLGAVTGVCFSPDGTLLAGAATQIMVWRADQLIYTLGPYSKTTRPVCFSPNSALLASSDDNEDVLVWKIATGECLHVLKTDSMRIRAMYFSSDDLLCTTSVWDVAITVWNVETGHTVQDQRIGWRFSFDSCFSHDGALAASPDNRSGMAIWHTVNDGAVQVFKDFSHGVTALSFSPDSTVLAVAYDKMIIVLWDIVTGHLLRVFRYSSRVARALCISPDGRLIVSGYDDGTISVWKMPLRKTKHFAN